MSHSSSSPDVTQPTGEEGTMRSDSGDSATNTSPQIPTTSLPTVSDMPVSMEVDQPPEQPIETSIQGNGDAANPRMFLSSKKLLIPMVSSRTWSRAINVDPRRLEDKIKETKETVGEEGGPPESESLKAQHAEAKAFELSGKTGEEVHNKNVYDLNELGGEEMKGLKDNSVAVPQEIAMKAALTHTMDQKHSTTFPKSSTNVTQPTGEEGKMPSDSDDSPHLHPLLPPLPTVSDICVSMEDAFPVEQPLETSTQGNDFAPKEIAYFRALNDFLLSDSIEGNVDPAQLEDMIKELKEAVGEEAFELSGKTGEEGNKNVDDLIELGGEEMKGLKVGEERNKDVDNLKDNSVAVPREIGVEANLTTGTEPLQSSIQGNDEAAKPRARIDLDLNEPPCQEDEDVAHQITLPKDIADFVKNLEENVGKEGGPPESESWEA